MPKKNATGSGSDGRARAWAAIVYPDSAPENWRDLLDDTHIEWAESPLHDQDINPGTGEVKKPHWHILLAFEGKKSLDQVREILAPLNCSLPIVCASMRGAVRYMAHLDNPEKAPYSPSAIVSHGGFDVASMLAPSSSQRYQIIRDMQSWCWREGVTEFCDLFDYAARERFDDWFPLLCDSCAFVMQTYLRSRCHACSEAKAAPAPQPVRKA